MTGAFYAMARWFLSLLPVDQAGERVFDETLADCAPGRLLHRVLGERQGSQFGPPAVARGHERVLSTGRVVCGFRVWTTFHPRSRWKEPESNAWRSRRQQGLESGHGFRWPRPSSATSVPTWCCA